MYFKLYCIVGSFMFEKKPVHNDILEKIATGNILLDINLEQEMSGFENHPTTPSALMGTETPQDSIILSPNGSQQGAAEEAGGINLEYYGSPTKEDYIEDDFAHFCMLQFNLKDKEDVLDFIKNEINLERSIAHIDKIYSLNEAFIAKQAHNPNGFKHGIFTDILLSHDMTLEEIAVLFTTMKHFNYHKSRKGK